MIKAMKAKIVILLLALVILFGALSYYLYTSRGGMYVKMAIKVFESGRQVNSESDVRTLFNQSFSDILSNTTQTLISNSSSPGCGASLQNMLQNKSPLIQNVYVDYHAWNYSEYWIGNSNESEYVVTVPIISQNETWKYENNTVYVRTKECTGGVLTNGECHTDWVETWERAMNLFYIVDSSGIIYYAGSPYC